MIKIIFENKKIINEIKMEQVLPRLDSKEFEEMALKKFKKMYGYSDFDEKSLKHYKKQFISMSEVVQDEKYRPEALNWLITNFINNRIEIITYPIASKLNFFYTIKKANKPGILSKTNIYDIHGEEELDDVLDKAKPAWEAYLKEKENLDAEKGTRKIYEDNYWNIYIPLNKGAACKLGKDTSWCTAAPGLEYYNRYTQDKDEPLIIFISKQQPGEKYQFQYKKNGDHEFKDRNNNQIQDIFIKNELNELVKKIADKINPFVKEESNKFSLEYLPNGGYRVEESGNIEYYNKDQEYHREDGPAIEEKSGFKSWWLNGKRHREDGPAIEFPDGTKSWYLNGQFLRNEEEFLQTLKTDREQNLFEVIRRKNNKYCLYSKKTNRNLGCYKTKAEVKKRERQVQYFKHIKEEVIKVLYEVI